jgi:DNA ligase (NAD+)
MSNLKERMIFLVDYLNKHQDLYDKGMPAISDSAWDEAYLELKELEIAMGEVLPNSPTQKIRYTVVSELKKVKHEYQPMLSLDKTKDIEEIKRFLGDKEWIAMLKLDGLTCRLTYEEGRLVRAETRGDGVEGEDITHNARVLSSIPKIIPYKDTLVVDGEVICDKTTFEQFKDEYANCRNFAAGSIRLLDSNECAKRGLTFVAWDVITGYEDYDTSLNKKLTTLIDYDFTVVPFSMLYLETVVDDLQEDNNKYTNYPIDGIVFKYNKNGDYYTAGRTDHHFRGGMAFKFEDDEYETELLDIEWSMGRTGVLTPVAVYKDVEIDGATCNRANLHNLNIITGLFGSAVLKGQKIWVYKANQIIPQISKVQPAEEILGVDPAYFFGDSEVEFINPPHTCPICNGDTEVRTSDSGTHEVYCTNPQCPGKLVNILDHFCGKKGLDIKGLSKATLEKLIDWGWVTCISDIFKLGEVSDLWACKPGFGPKSVTKLLDAIYAARKCPLHAYLSAWSIPLIGKTYALQLAVGFITYEEFRKAVREGFDFTQLDKFGPERHEAIINFDYSEADSLIERGIIEIVVNESDALENSGNALEGKPLCVTGKLKHFKNRDELSAAITAAGGKVTSSVSSKTDYLVNNDVTSTSAKNLKAKELNIPIITEEELMELMK